MAAKKQTYEQAMKRLSICQCAMRMRYVPHGTLTNYYFTTS